MDSVVHEFFVVGCETGRTRWLAKGRQGHWVVTLNPESALAFATYDAAEEARDTYLAQGHESHIHASGGTWAVYQMTTKITFRKLNDHRDAVSTRAR